MARGAQRPYVVYISYCDLDERQERNSFTGTRCGGTSCGGGRGGGGGGGRRRGGGRGGEGEGGGEEGGGGMVQRVGRGVQRVGRDATSCVPTYFGTPTIYPHHIVLFNEREKTWHLCDENGIYAEIDPYHVRGAAFSCTMRVETMARNAEVLAVSKAAAAAAAGTEQEFVSKSVVIKDLIQVATLLKTPSLEHMATPCALVGVFGGSGAEWCAKNFHVKLLPLLGRREEPRD